MRPQMIVVPIAIVIMVLGVVLGTLRLLSLHGILDPTPLASLQPHHGELMVFSFLAILILTERFLGAATFSLHPVVNSLPFLMVGGGVLKLLSWIAGVAALNLAGSIVIATGVILYIYLLYKVGKQSAQFLPVYFMILGALVLLVAAILNVAISPTGYLPYILFLISFPMFTIMGERVELSRFLSPQVYRRARWGLWVIVAATILLLLRILVVDSRYLVTAWAGLLAVAVVGLFRSELTLVKMGQRGLHRYQGQHLLFAYGWFFLALIILVLARESYPLYDAATHALAIGFIGSMMMAHAPMIAPTMLHRKLAEERLSYLPLRFLTLAVAMRVLGDLLKAAGAPLPALAGLSGIVVFMALIAFATMMVRSLRPA